MISVLISVSGCGKPQVIRQTETVEVPVIQYAEVDQALIAPVPVPGVADVLTARNMGYMIVDLYWAIHQCNYQLGEIDYLINVRPHGDE